MNRRDLFRNIAATLPFAALGNDEKLPPVRAITRGPKFHWFGYYDKLQFDPSSRYVLCNEVGFEHRSPEPDDVIKLGMIDTADGDRWVDLGETRAWCWQQGCMLQWLPGSKTEVIWNDREGDRYVSHILDVKTRKKRTLPGPVYGISPDARWAVSPDFRRLHDTRPGYGYAGIPDPNQNVLAPADAGIWKMDLKTGKRSLIISIADAAKVGQVPDLPAGAKHWFNHLLVSPDAKRFIFLHRWRVGADTNPMQTCMFTANADGRDLYVLNQPPMTSHFIWRDPKHVLAWAQHPSQGNKFYLFEDKTEKVEAIGAGVMTRDGHCSYLPGKRFILADSYPDKQRNQNPYLFDTQIGKLIALGHFNSPKPYTGEWRCDTHPRFSPDGRKVTIDSPHGGGRQLYLIDISAIVG